MSSALLITINLVGSGVLAFAGSFAGSYIASKRATHRAEQEERGQA